MIPDPFAEVEPGFEPWQGPPEADLSQPDLTPCSLKDWLRSDEVTKAVDRLHPARPTPPRARVCLDYIQSFPR
jgi:hypothetical protein